VISGEARWSVVEPEGYHDTFQAWAGDLVFLSQGSFHYFENGRHDQDLTVLIVFNTSAEEPKDDIGIVAASRHEQAPRLWRRRGSPARCGMGEGLAAVAGRPWTLPLALAGPVD
jgi:hypothetical protein